MFYFWESQIEKLKPGVHMYKGTQVGTKVINGRVRPTYEYEDYVQTPQGDMPARIWVERMREAVRADGQEELLEAIKVHVRRYCVWLRNEKRIEEYALECLAIGAYNHWKDFKEDYNGLCTVNAG